MQLLHSIFIYLFQWVRLTASPCWKHPSTLCWYMTKVIFNALHYIIHYICVSLCVMQCIFKCWCDICHQSLDTRLENSDTERPLPAELHGISWPPLSWQLRLKTAGFNCSQPTRKGDIVNELTQLEMGERGDVERPPVKADYINLTFIKLHCRAAEHNFLRGQRSTDREPWYRAQYRAVCLDSYCVFNNCR